MELFIELVRAQGAIYDKSHKNYKDRSGVVANLWTEIARTLREEGHEEFIGR